MHKKYSKFNHKDHHHCSSKKIHARSKKDTTDSRLEVPQNSRSDINKKSGIENVNTKEEFKHKKEKHKKSEDAQSNDRHGKRKHDKKLVYNISDIEGLVLNKEAVSHKEKKEKRDKERLNKIEKYLEGLDKACNKKIKHNRSHSLGSSESVFRNQNTSFQRDKTFNEKLKRHASTNSHLNVSEEKDSRHPTNTHRKKSSKKHKHNESKERESSKEKNTKDTPISYCHVETLNPFFHKKKKYKVERLYPEESNIIHQRSSRRRSSSRDSYSPPRTKLEVTSKHKNRESMEKRIAPVKFSPRRSKLKTDLRNSKDQKSSGSLGPYRKYFAFDKRSQIEKETTRHKKKRHRKVDSAEKADDHRNKKEKKIEPKPDKSKKNQEKVSSHSDQYKEKIDDDIKSYFTRIQSLIDKKLDFILGHSNSKETKTSSADNESVVEKTKSKKHKKEESEDELRLVDRSHSKRKKSEKRNVTETQKREKRSDGVVRVKHSEEKRATVEARRVRNSHTSSTSLRRERYPSADSRSHRRRPTPPPNRPYENYQSAGPVANTLENSNETRQEKRNRSPFREHRESKMKPDRLINMLEHPSTFSLQSQTSLIKEQIKGEPKRKSRQNQKESSGKDHYQRRDPRQRSSVRDDAIPNEGNFKFNELEHAYVQDAYTKKMRRRAVEHPFTFPVESNTYLRTEGVDEKGHHHKRDRSLTKKYAAPDEDDFKRKELEAIYMQEIHNKKIKKRMRQMMNLECKTVSIVGIPSQLRESTIFNETQTTTSLNVINQVEDFIEKKKKSRRFKLYYKYSVADNKCSNESDKSSEGKKSIISDSYRVVSDPSDPNIDVWEDNQQECDDLSKDSMAKILFIMKNKKFQKHCGDVSGKHNSVERAPKKYRKRGDSPKPAILNNILEEPSNISIVVHHSEAPTVLTDNLDCTFFNTLKSSSSDCDLELIKRNDRSFPSHKYKNHYGERHFKETTVKPKAPSRRDQERSRQCEIKKSKYDEKYEYQKKIRKMDSQQKIKRREHNRSAYKFNSKSDINISYDSLTQYKHKNKQNFEGATHIREQLNRLPEMPVRQSSPERKPIDMILKEELRQILKEIPRSMACKETSFHDIGQIEAPHTENKCIEKEIREPKVADDKEPIENQRDENKCQSKKTGTHQVTTKIPSLIKGYVGNAHEHVFETNSSTKQENQDAEAQENLEKETEGKLVDTATEIDITEENLETVDATENTLENKMSQTPTPKVDAGVEVAMATATHKASKKVPTAGNVKRCQILDPFTSSKVGYTVKTTRPIINLENNHFPNRKVQEASDSSRPASALYKRQKSSMSEGRTVKFEHGEEFQDKIRQAKQRPVSVEKGTPNKSQRIPTKSALTMSTNVITINSPVHTEKYVETYDVQNKLSKNSVVADNPNHTNKHYAWDKRAATASCGQRTQEELSSKSALSLNDMDVESRIGSLVCADKFTNYRKINLSSNSNSRSLDRYAMKSIINDNPHASRLFLTKNFNSQMNTYQRRKMYDETIRKKMKKKYGNQNQMGPRIFEVRYLTLESENLKENLDNNQAPSSTHRCINKLPTFNTKANKPRQRAKAGKPTAKKSRKNFPKNKEDACKFSGRDIFAPLISDVDQLNKFRRKTFPETNVKEIFVRDGASKKEKTLQDDIQQSSSVDTDEKCISSECLNSSLVKKENVDPNFKELIDCLYNSIISYCNSKFTLPQEAVTTSEQKLTTELHKAVEERLSDPKPPPINEISYVVFPKSPREKRNSPRKGNQPATTDKKNSSSEGNVSSDEKQSKRPTDLISGHLSCPVLAGSTSSFDYLYEDGSIELNKEAVLSHFRKPMKTILGYAFSNTHYVHKRAILGFPKKEDQISNSATESEESGYSSNNSKKCTSVCSFFKKPSIANLFKPVRKLEGGLQSATSSVADSRSGPNLQEYDVMNQRCKEYAEKVRIQSQNKNEPVETFQEIPLDVLLFCKKSCTGLGDFNSNCSLCKKHSSSDLPDITELDELSNNIDNLDCLEDKTSSDSINLVQGKQNNNTLSSSKIQAETLIFYQDLDHRPSLEIISFQKSETNFTNDDTSQLIKEMTQCPVVVSITNLNTCSLTVIEESATDHSEPTQIENVQDVAEKESYHVTNSNSRAGLKSSSQVDLDGRSDISSNSGFRNTNSLSATSKYMAKRFFDNLLKVYEKEMHVTNKLFQDEEFFADILLESIKSGEVTKTRNNTKFKKLIKGKIKSCIGNVFFSKSGLDGEYNRIDTQATPSRDNHQRKLQILASDARQYFSMFVQAVKTNKDINDEVKICGLLKLLERIEDGDFAVLRRKEDVDFEEEIRKQVKEAFVNIYQISVKEAKKRRRSLTPNDLRLIQTFVSKYRIGLLSKTDLIASYIGRGVFKTEGHLKAAVTYLIQQNKNKDLDLRDFDQHCKILEKCSG